ncbi:MAG: hypothetical protein IT258_20470 [Saprospiraceae bacterium]|nr:hypothetical protein [Saprospiraceae bacterium]
MKTSTSLPQLFTLQIICLLALLSQMAWSQCNGLVQVTHQSGTETVGCTDVTITSDGSVDYSTSPPCNYGPYWVGRLGNGSFTFSFSTPVSGVMIDVQSITDGEEMSLEVNGSFFPIAGGSNNGCEDPATVWPPGTLRAVTAFNCGLKEIYVPGPITTLTIIDNWYAGPSFGFIVNLFVCCPACETDAGQITADRLDKCMDEMASVPPADQTNLDGNDLLQYILFSDPADTLGSAIATNSTPVFAFDPATMSLGTTYYIAAVAGNNLGGNVDPNDNCLDFSNAIEVAWWGHPAVAFSSDDTCIMPDNCYDIMALFTGTQPFQLTGQVLSGSNVVTAFSGTFTTDSPVNVCLPANTPEGPINIVATGLSDAHCTCD